MTRDGHHGDIPNPIQGTQMRSWRHRGTTDAICGIQCSWLAFSPAAWEIGGEGIALPQDVDHAKRSPRYQSSV